MDRHELITALERGPGDGARACTDALRAGAQVAFEREFATSELVTIYQARSARHAQVGGIPTVGFSEAVHHLVNTDHDRLRLIGVEATEPRYQFLVFVAPAAPEVVACLGGQPAEEGA